MGSQIPQFHVMFFPLMAHGHMIPILDIAKLFGARGLKTTIVTTPANAPFFSHKIQTTKHLGVEIDIKIIKFPTEEAGLSEGCENLDATNNDDPSMEMTMNFFMAIPLLKEPFEQLLRECKPDCLVADKFFSWATDTAAKYGIPRLVFHGMGFFALSAMDCMGMYKPYKNVSSDSEPILLPGFPGDINFTRKELPDFVTSNDEFDFVKLFEEATEAELKSHGVVVNSFYELESAYADYYRNVSGKKAWHIGPVSLCNNNVEEKAWRGKQASIDQHACLKWLSSKKPDSVVYICFGTLAEFSSAQLMEIAIGLEASGQQFIWVVKKVKNDEQEKEDWLPEGFEKRMEGKGLIIRGWAPQVLILEHEAVGGFVTHCGWNSILEGVSAGVTMVTWPVFSEQFWNEKLVTQVHKIGVGVGVQRWARSMGDFVKREAIEKAVKEIMVGDGADEMRKRAKALGLKARRAVEEGGSSFSDLNALVQELSLLVHK